MISMNLVLIACYFMMMILKYFILNLAIVYKFIFSWQYEDDFISYIDYEDLLCDCQCSKTAFEYEGNIYGDCKE